ncbi:MAG: hypothetical protein JST39_09835 [Bacteroidetes bacterium]|nr:hypothetical protein [Bacteroidota bacterium]
MMKKNLLVPVVILSAGILASCSGGGQKKVKIVASGKVSVKDNIISLDPGMTHNETEQDFSGSKVTLTVNSSKGESKTFDLTEDGTYLLNLQTDTLIGGVVNYGEGGGRPGSISAEFLDHIIDSTQQLMAGKNASDASKTFFLPPFTVKKISAADNARIVGSFNGIPNSNEPDASGKTPEVFKFFTNKQKRETLTELITQREKLKSVQ